MFKSQRQNRKSKENLIEKHFDENASNFKSGSIEMSTEEMLFRKLKDLNEIVDLPKPNQQFRIVTQKQINSFDFVLAVLHDERIEEMIVAFYRIGKKVLQEIFDLQNSGKIGCCHFLVNDGVSKLTPETWNLLKQLESEKWIVKTEHNHTKIILLKTDKNNHYVIEGSGNLSRNARIEQYSFDNHEMLYNFHKKWITEL